MTVRETLLACVLFGLFLVAGCSDRVEMATPPTGAGEPNALFTPTPVANQAIKKGTITEESADREFYSPTETCERIDDVQERSICSAIVDAQDIENEALTAEFNYTSRQVDLNGDGQKEVIAWIPTGGLGGTSGYPVLVLSRSKDGFKEILDIDQAWTPIIVLRPKINGFNEIALQTAGGGVEPRFEIMRFSKGSYKWARSQKTQPNGDVIIDKNWQQTVFGPIAGR